MNVVFDVGNVLLAWRAGELLGEFLASPAEREAARRGLLEHPDWIELDRGTLPYDQAIARAAARTGLAPATIAAILGGVSQALIPIPESVALLRRLRAEGHPTYVLSNMHHWPAAAIEQRCDFWDGFAGVVFSCRVGLVKPEPGIYRHLLAAHALNPADTVFIDDLPVNIAAARALGMHGIVFQNAGQCLAELELLPRLAPAGP